MLRAFSVLIALLIAVAGSAAFGASGEWGTLTGRFIYDGTPPTPEKIKITKDTEVCEKHAPVYEKLVVGKSGGLANVLVYLRTTGVDEHPSYLESARAEVPLDNHQCRFNPHMVLLRTTQTLVIKNSDPIPHNTNVQTFENPGSNPIVPAMGEIKKQLSAEERTAMPVNCNIHPWMQAWLLVRKSPYMAASNANGEFVIENLPAGKPLEFQLWHEGKGNLKNLKVKGAKVDTKGRMKITLKSGVNDLGAIKIKPSSVK